MDEDTQIHRFTTSNQRWLLPLGLAILIAAIILGAYLATHHSSSASGKATATSTAKPAATATVVAGGGKSTPGSTGTPRPGPTGTARPGPTGTPRAAPTITAVTSLKTGAITYPGAALTAIQAGAHAGNPTYTYYLDPFKVVQRDLAGKFGFTSGGITVISPPAPPQPTPTPYRNSQGLPQINITIQYAGKRYQIVLEGLQVPGGLHVWVIVRITPVATPSTPPSPTPTKSPSANPSPTPTKSSSSNPPPPPTAPTASG